MSITLPVEILLSEPCRDGAHTLTSAVIDRRRNGADLRAEAVANAESTDAMGLVQVQRMCGLLPATVNKMPLEDVDSVISAIQAMTEEPPVIDVWPYVLAHPIPGLSEVQKPRKALGGDARKVGAIAGDRSMLRLLVWVELLCGLSSDQINAMDAVDVEALMVGVRPFYKATLSPKPSSDVPTTSPSSVTGSPQS